MYWFVAIAFSLAASLAVAAETAPAEVSVRTLALENPYAVVEAFKQIFEKNLEPPPEGYDPKSRAEFLIDTCLYTTDFRSIPVVQYFEQLKGIAKNEMTMADEFKEAGYPESLWREPLRDLTKTQIANLQRYRAKGGNVLNYDPKKLNQKAEKHLEKLFKDYRKANGGKLRDVVSLPGCGGDYIGSAVFGTDPPGGIIKVIKEFHYLLCQATGRDPLSDKCDLWENANINSQFPEGAYRYRIRWADRLEECGKGEFAREGQGEVKMYILQATNTPCKKPD